MPDKLFIEANPDITLLYLAALLERAGFKSDEALALATTVFEKVSPPIAPGGFEARSANYPLPTQEQIAELTRVFNDYDKKAKAIRQVLTDYYNTNLA